tara:strand:- start:655 stop:1050 length:396 start_codon:yes stop_codon:yes gene_type:complete
MKRTEYKYIVELSRYNKQERTIYIDENNNYVYKWDNRIFEIMDHQYDLVTIPIEKMTRGMLNEYTKSLYKNIKFWIERSKEQEHKLDEYRKFINMFVSKESLQYLDKLDEKLDGYEVNIDLFDDQKYESVG